MDIKRITSGLLGFPLVLITLLIGNKYVVDILLTIVAILAMDEYLNAISKVCKPIRWVAYVSCISIALIHVIPQEFLSVITILAIPVIFLVLFSHVIATNMKVTFKDVAYTLLGIFYVVFFMMFVAIIDGMDNGKILIWYAIFDAWGKEIFEYFILPKKNIKCSASKAPSPKNLNASFKFSSGFFFINISITANIKKAKSIL